MHLKWYNGLDYYHVPFSIHGKMDVPTFALLSVSWWTVITVHVFRTFLVVRKEFTLLVLSHFFALIFFWEFASLNMQKIILCAVRFNPLWVAFNLWGWDWTAEMSNVQFHLSTIKSSLHEERSNHNGQIEANKEQSKLSLLLDISFCCYIQSEINIIATYICGLFL